MPIYEYQCEQCRKVFSFLVRNVATHQPPTCPGCGHGKMTRALSRFAAHPVNAARRTPMRIPPRRRRRHAPAWIV